MQTRPIVVVAAIPKLLAGFRPGGGVTHAAQTSPGVGSDAGPLSEGTLVLTVDGKCRHVRISPDERAHLGLRLIAIELPGEKKRQRTISSSADLLQCLELAIRTRPSNCGSIKGVRPLRRGQTGKRIVYFASLKNRAQMQCESRLEAAHALGYEDAPFIRIYRCQPLRLHFGIFYYTPDVLVQDPHGAFGLYEVKPAGKLENPKTAARLAIIQLLLSRQQIPFQVLTQDSDRLLTSERGLIYTRMSKQHKTEFLVDSVRRLMVPEPSSKLADLRARAMVQGFGAGSVERLLWERRLHADGSIEAPSETTVGLLVS